MTTRHGMAGFVLATLIVLTGSALPTQAKPPDLPVDLGVRCLDAEETRPHGSITIGLDLFSGKLSVRVQLNEPKEAQAPCVDAFGLLILQHCLQQWWEQILYPKRCLEPSNSKVPDTFSDRLLENEAPAPGGPRRDLPEEVRRRQMLKETQPLGLVPVPPESAVEIPIGQTNIDP